MTRAPTPRQLFVRLEPDVACLAGMRRRLRDWMHDVRSPSTATEETLVVATELCANAVEAASSGAAIWLEVTDEGGQLCLAVVDAGDPVGPVAVPALEHGSLQERGRGLAIVAALADRVTATSEPGRTVVRAWRRW